MIPGDLALLIVDTMAEGVCLVRSVDATIVYANPRFTTMLGYAVGELDDQPITLINYEREPGTAMQIYQAIAEQLERKGEAIYEVLGRRKDGTPLWCRARATSFEHPDHGRVWVVVASNIEAEKQLEQQRLLMCTLAEQLPIGLWITDPRGVIRQANAAGERIWAGPSPVGADAFGVYQRAWWADTGKPLAVEDWALTRALSKRETTLGEVVRIQCFDGSSKTILVSAAPVIGSDGELLGAIVVNQDITPLQNAIRARDEILGVVAHDLRAPLNLISLRTSALADDLGQLAAAGPRRTWLDGIQRAVAELERQIEDLLDTARLVHGEIDNQLSEVELSELVAEAIERSTAHAGTRSLHNDCRAPLPLLRADRGRLMQVLDNLLGNAIKFTRPGDTITIGAERRELDVHLWVSDSGPGLTPEQLARVFERSWQAQRGDRRGLGLGLAIVRDIIAAHGGHVWATSELGSGATFHISLPIDAGTF